MQTLSDRPAILATAWTWAGDVSPLSDQQQSPFDIRTRFHAIASSGWPAVGLLAADVRVAVAELGWSGLRALIADSGVLHIEFEFLTDWWSSGKARDESDEDRVLMFEAAAQLDGSFIKIGGDLVGGAPSFDLMATELGKLATEAESRETRLAFEPIPFSNIPDIPGALALIEAVGSPALGLAVDICHVYRSGLDFDEIPKLLTANQIFSVELADGRAVLEGSAREDTVNNRLLPGLGEFGADRFVRAIRASGWSGYWGVEIMSAKHRALPLSEAVDSARDATVELLKSAE